MPPKYRDATTGEAVVLAGPLVDGRWVTVRGSSGVRLIDIENLEEVNAVTGVRQRVEAPEEPEPVGPEPIPDLMSETRLNLNVADAGTIAAHVRGIGFSTARKIVELRSTLPGEKFRNIEQLRSIGRVNWDALIADDLFFVG